MRWRQRSEISAFGHQVACYRVVLEEVHHAVGGGGEDSMKTSHKVGAAVIGLVAISAGCAWTHYFPRFDATVVVDPAPFATATTFDFARWQ